MTEPIILEKPITLYDANGNAIRSYKLELGEIVTENGKVLIHNVNGWSNHFRERVDGISFLNLPEAYAAIEQMYETHKVSALENFFKDLTEYGIFLNTQFDYNRNITTHYFGSNDKLELSPCLPERSGKIQSLTQDLECRDAIQKMLDYARMLIKQWKFFPLPAEKHRIC